MKKVTVMWARRCGEENCCEYFFPEKLEEVESAESLNAPYASAIAAYSEACASGDVKVILRSKVESHG